MMSLIYLLSPEKTSPRRLLSRLNAGDYDIEWFTVGVVKGIFLSLREPMSLVYSQAIKVLIGSTFFLMMKPGNLWIDLF